MIVYEFLLLVDASRATNKIVNILIYKDTDFAQSRAEIATVPDILGINLMNNLKFALSILRNVQYDL